MIDMKLWEKELDKLPHKGKRIRWKDSVGYELNYINDNLQFKIKIVNYYKIKDMWYLDVQYNNNIYNIRNISFLYGKLGNILGLYSYNYKYQIGNIITNVHSGKLKILEQIRIKIGDKNIKGYKYRCLICGNEDIISENNLVTKYAGCSVCSNQKVLVGYNDIWTTNFELAKLLADPNDGYKYMQNSHKKVNWRCPSCGNIIKNKQIKMVNMNNLSCPKCSDGISIPEKIMFNILQQLNIDFIYQYSPKWCKYKLNNKNKTGRYDFYFKLNNKRYIVETDGNWHNKDNILSGQTKEESKQIDDIKDKLANEHNIEVIRIDCKESELDYIRNKILESKLNKLFDLSNIDWKKAEEFTCSSLVRQACNYWNDGIHSTKEIGKIMNLNRHTILTYLKKGNKLNWCNYDPDKLIKTRIICLNTNKIFDSITEAGEKNNINISNLVACCQHKIRRKSAGKDPITGEKLKWMYYDEYLKLHKQVS